MKLMPCLVVVSPEMIQCGNQFLCKGKRVFQKGVKFGLTADSETHVYMGCVLPIHMGSTTSTSLVESGIVDRCCDDERTS